jgi:hypothetical protein
MSMDYAPYRTGLFVLHDKHEIMPALHEVHGALDIVAFWSLFREGWSMIKSLYTVQTHIRDMLTEERLNSPGRLVAMRKTEIDWLKRAARRDKPVKIYRGGSDANVTGFSWTTKRALAEWHAVRSGFEKTSVVVGRIQPHQIILYLEPGDEIVCFPEHVKVEKIDDHHGLRGDDLTKRRVQALVEALGANHVMGLTPVEYFMDALEHGRADRDMVLKHMDESATFLEPLGFARRAQTCRDIAAAIRGKEDGIRSATG